MPTILNSYFWLTVASTVALVWAQISEPPIMIVLGIEAIAVIFYARGIYLWLNTFKHPNVTTGRTHEKGLKLFGISIFSLIALFILLYSHRMLTPSRDDEVNKIKADNERYRRIIGIDKSLGTTVLLDLTNAELKRKGTVLVQEIRNLNDHYGQEERELQNQFNRKEIDEAKLLERRHEAFDRAGKGFDRDFNTQALVTLAELRNRVPKDKQGQFFSLPDIKPADSRDSPVSLHGAFPSSPFTFVFSASLANEIERLTTLLPD